MRTNPVADTEARDPAQQDVDSPVEKLIIEGGKTLSGRVEVAGSKNAVLAILPAFLLAPGKSHLTAVPNLRDVQSMVRLLEHLGATVEEGPGTLAVDASTLTSHEAPYKIVSKMRASFYVLGPLLARLGKARVSLPGGCAWGPRPVNLHLEGLRALGAEMEVDHGYVVAKADRLRGGRVHFDVSSVGATAHIMMAAALAEGITEISNAACEPEVVALAECLQAMGVAIEGAGTSTMTVHGESELHPVSFRNIPDRIEAGTYMIAGAMAGGEIEIANVIPEHLTAAIGKLGAAGADFWVDGESVYVRRRGRLTGINVSTDIHPGFPTDLQAQMVAALSVADGASLITDSIYHDRFAHVAELRRLGANIVVKGNSATVIGVDALSGTYVQSKDLRASASLVLAGLVADGETHVTHIHHLDRGYESLETKLRGLGASIRRVEDPNGDA